MERFEAVIRRLPGPFGKVHTHLLVQDTNQVQTVIRYKRLPCFQMAGND